MATGILQPDGTRCYSGPTCSKHSYTDSHGNPSTREALVVMIDDAMEEGNFDVYYAERQNLEDLDESRTPSKDDDYATNIPVMDSSLNKLEEDIWDDFNRNKKSEDMDWYDPATSGLVNSYDVEGTDPEATLENRKRLILSAYAANATPRGIENLERQYDYKRVMADHISIPMEGKPSHAISDVRVQESYLVAKKQKAADNHIQWKQAAHEKYNMMVSIGSTPQEAATSLLSDVKETRSNNERLLKEIKFDFMYNKREIDYYNYDEVAPKIVESVKKIQFLHDTLIYSKIQENELKNILE